MDEDIETWTRTQKHRQRHEATWTRLWTNGREHRKGHGDMDEDMEIWNHGDIENRHGNMET